MAQIDVAVPTLPARNLDETLGFYDQIGFKLAYRNPDPDEYVIVRRGPLELHFFLWPELDVKANYSGCYIRVKDVDDLYQAFATARLPARGTPSLAGIEKKYYSMREFHLLDPNGNLLRVGEELKKPATKGR
jgi:catechol 2,3-dioxygenase-like lactoylglutathione lyase family enzyme